MEGHAGEPSNECAVQMREIEGGNRRLEELRNGGEPLGEGAMATRTGEGEGGVTFSADAMEDIAIACV